MQKSVPSVGLLFEESVFVGDLLQYFLVVFCRETEGWQEVSDFCQQILLWKVTPSLLEMLVLLRTRKHTERGGACPLMLYTETDLRVEQIVAAA